MCGICGITLPKNLTKVIDSTLLGRMTQSLIHRGPDEEGVYLDPDRKIGLGFRRLSVIDLSTGSQPLANEDKTLWVVFNGEIYNFQELRQELEALGHVFRTKSDTETLLHGYEQYGTSLVDHLRGMFAFAIWDANKRELFMARDRLGKKPLYYAFTEHGFFFASELKALTQAHLVSKEIDPQALRLYLIYGYIPAPWSILTQVKKLPPAHVLTLDVAQWRVSTHKYWEPVYAPKLDLPPETVESQFTERLREAVRLRMISDVPLGALLSGGIDSSLVVALMAEQSNRPVRTFTIGFEDSGFDERPYARQVAERYGTQHHAYVVRENAAELLPRIAWFLDEPMADSSALPSYYVAQMARQEVTVVLNGDGGDENFGGYWHHGAVLDAIRFASLPHALRNGLIRPAASVAYALTHHSFFQRLHSLTEQSTWKTWALHERRMELFRPEMRAEILPPHDESEKVEYFSDLYHGPERMTITDQILRADLLGVLPGQLLVKMDRMTMAHSLEARSPFLDQEVVEFAARLPIEYKINRGEKKILLRTIAKEYLPPALIERRKMGFVAPLEKWFQQGLGQQALVLLGEPKAKIYSYLSFNGVQPILHSAIAGDSAAAARIWSLMILEFWLKEFV